MSRTTAEIEITDFDNAVRIIERIMAKYNYKNKIVKGESVYAQGDGVIMAMSCFGYNFGDNKLILQAWVKDAIMGEYDLSGFAAMAVKKKMKRIIEEIKQSLY